MVAPSLAGKTWSIFQIDAEVDHFGSARICGRTQCVIQRRAQCYLEVEP